MAELVLSAVLPLLFKKLMSAELLKFSTQEGVGSKLQKWEKTLKMIDALLMDAEEKQPTSRAVKMWLEELQELAYDAEDILDEYATEALRRKLKIEEHQASNSRTWKLKPACCVGHSPTALWSDVFGMRSKIDGITSRLQDLCNQRSELNLVETAGKRRIGGSRERAPTTSLKIEPVVYGRDEDKSKILDMVLSVDAGYSNYGVISIIGMGGLGKTTLAQSVYNDESVKEFNPKGWVCVSDDFDVLKISIGILESITGTASDLQNLDAVQNQIKEKVSGRKFLLVLDDVWSDDYDKWQRLQAPFMDGASGSKIIVTTRNVRVALTMGNPEGCHKLQGISDDDSWSLFKNHALANQPLSSQCHVELVRQKVVEKCKGLPLAARTLGGLLRCKRRDEWLDILNSRTWELLDNSEIPAALHLSYYHLPSHLKRCFAYCGILPKDHQFEEKELVLLWMAEGLIQESDNNKQLEASGGEYFRDLVARSIFQISSVDPSKFTMHDLVNDLAVKVSSNLCFRSGEEMPWKISEKTRYASYLCQNYNDKSKFEVLDDAKLLRSYLRVAPAPFDSLYVKDYISNAAVSYLFSKFKKLRMLSIQGYNIVEVPDSIGELRLLRYLNLSNSWIRRLPESINSMCNMQTLLLRNCTDFLSWPSSIGCLINLRHLNFSGAHLIKEMPAGMKKLVYLQTLSNFVVGKDSGSSLEDLEDINGLCGALHISRLENVTNFKQGRKILANKLSLKVLVLEWSTDLDESIIEEEESRNKELDESILDMLRPHQNLEELTVRGYGDKTFSSWVGDVSFCKMTVLSLEDCTECRSLPSLGLLDSLKHLTVKGLKGLKNINSAFYGQHCSNPFRSLESLHFENLENLESWEPVEENKSFPRLQDLCISTCPKISERLPKNLSSLKKLVIKSCEQLVVSLSDMPMLCELELEKCKKLSCASSASLASLENVRLSNISDVGDLSRELLIRVKNLKIEHCNELIEFWHKETVCKKSHEVFQSLNFLSRLELINCSTSTTLLEFIKQKNVPLEKLWIESCDALSSIFMGQFPHSLKKLVVENCENLQHLLADYEDISTSSSGVFHLEVLDISKCPSLNFLPSIDQLSAALTSLSISHCSELRTLSLADHLRLKHLSISWCAELATLSRRSRFPHTLETLEIMECGKLESMVEMFHKNKALHSIKILWCKSLKSLPKGLETLTNLQHLEIISCGDLASFPKGSFPDSNLRVSLRDCVKLEALPCGTHLLSSLEIYCCEKISYLPTKLEILYISDLNQYKAVVECGLHNCNSLRTLCIFSLPSEDFLSVTSMEMALPPNLNLLKIYSLPMLRCLNFKDFESLSFLKELDIFSCPELMSLPSILPSSLEHLEISNCLKLTSLPSILPSSLLSLRILRCPSLSKVCKRRRGKEWPKIADIPYVEIHE